MKMLTTKKQRDNFKAALEVQLLKMCDEQVKTCLKEGDEEGASLLRLNSLITKESA